MDSALSATISREPVSKHGRFMFTLENALYRLIIVPLVAFLPARLAYGVACLHGDWLYRLNRSKREEVMRCLESVFGDQLSLTERTRVSRDYFRQTSCIPVDVMRLAGKGRALKRLVEIRGLEHIEAALAAGKGAILCCAHFGSFKCAFSLIGAYGFPITFVGRWGSNRGNHRLRSIRRFFYRLTAQKTLAHHQRRANIEPVGQIEVAVQASTILRQNEMITLALDAPLIAAYRTRAVQVDFLNGQILVLPGATTIAQLMGAPVLMTFMRRSADWRHQVLEISPPMPLDGDAVTAYKRCLAAVEAAIRQNPSQWAYWNFRELVTLGLLSEEAINRRKSS